MAKTAEQLLSEWRLKVYNRSDFQALARDVECIGNAVKEIYIAKYPKDDSTVNKWAYEAFINNTTNIDQIGMASSWVYKNRYSDIDGILQNCAAKNASTTSSNTSKSSKETDYTVNTTIDPFDRRIYRVEILKGDKETTYPLIIPFSEKYKDLATNQYIMTGENLKKMKKDNTKKGWQDGYEQMKKNNFYEGVPSLQNNYALIRLYGSNGGKYLLNQKGERRWYEVDSVSGDNKLNFSNNPTTTSLISWGNADPHGRTPYQFTDFVFCKHWNKISNNRMITLRRYAAPALDNLNFPGMQDDISNSNSDTNGGGNTTGKIVFSPMASAVTYFGEGTGNSLNSLLKFSTGVLWDDATAAVWEVNADSVPESTPLSESGGLFGGIGKVAEMLNVAGGNFDPEYIANKGQLPPDPYSNGPYENRIQGPVNRIDSVKKRKPGLAFQWDGLNLVFDYVARPIGGVNPKAVLLDIMSNFLVIGSASAVFFGGAHRFMANPAKYPFVGGSKGIEKFYRGDPIGWGLEAVKDFTGDKGSGAGIGSSFLDSAKSFFGNLFSGEKGSLFGSLEGLMTGATGNIIKNEIAKKSAAVPYLKGLKAILTGEPVGEWHVTIGNPLNPIAMIGNLICEGIDVEFNEELGPDDFPTEMKITVKLKHGMARDRDAIESIFNRGMGRIYTLPDSFLGSADFQTTVDKATASDKSGTMPNRRVSFLYKEGMDTGYIPKGQIDGKPESNSGSVSVWDRGSFSGAVSENSDVTYSSKELFRSAYHAEAWISKKALS